MSLEGLHELRMHELEKVISILPNPKNRECKLLEIGAGVGWQAKKLARLGYDVTAIDVDASCYRENQVYPIRMFNGRDLLFDDQTFDVVFSSNVLEHVKELDGLLVEIQRVLKHSGISVHVLPSASWRLWTNVTFYPFVIKSAMLLLAGRLGKKSIGGSEEAHYVLDRAKRHTIKSLIVNSLYPRRHGEKGNVITETYYFSKYYWLKLFRGSNYKIVEEFPNELFYSGNFFFGKLLSINRRSTLSSILGSSCHIFKLVVRGDD